MNMLSIKDWLVAISIILFALSIIIFTTNNRYTNT